MNRPICHCEQCGRPFRGAVRTARFCSLPCREAWHAAQQAAEEQARQAAEQRPCAQCGAPFVPRAKKQRFCSRSCENHAKYLARHAEEQHHAAIQAQALNECPYAAGRLRSDALYLPVI